MLQFNFTQRVTLVVFNWIKSFILLYLGATAQSALGDTSDIAALSKEKVATVLAGIAVPFEENRGQAAAEVAFQAKTLAGHLFVTKTGELVWSLTPPSSNNTQWDKFLSKQVFPAEFVGPPAPTYSIVERFVGGTFKPYGKTAAATQVNYFHGNDPSKWHNGVPTWQQVSLGQVWSGIEVSVAARGNNVEKLFTVAPGADVSKIAVEVAGGDLAVTKEGALQVNAATPILTFTPPIAYQDIAGQRKPVAVQYRLAAATNRYGFTLGTHDATQPVIIDPLLQSTYLGGISYDYVSDMAVSSDAVYIVGYTRSNNFPGTSIGAQVSFGGGPSDAFVAKLSLDLKSLIQASYLGGNRVDYIQTLSLSNSAVYVAGHTSSNNFPGTRGGPQEVNAGGNDAFVAKLSLDLKSIQAGYLGGSGVDEARAVISSSDAVYVAGLTGSSDFPSTSDGAQAIFGGGSCVTDSETHTCRDAFVAKLSLDLKSLTQASYLGGNDNDFATSLSLSSSAVYVAGHTSSNNFPGTSGGAQVNKAVNTDAFVAKLSLDLKSLTKASYLGGNSIDGAFNLNLNSSAVYVSGITTSNDFPRTNGGAQATCGSCTKFVDVFVAKLNLDLTTLTQASYLGGNAFDRIYGLNLSNSNVYVVGYTGSSNFPGTIGGVQPSCRGCTSYSNTDAFVAKLSLDLKSLAQASYLGGGGDDRGYAVNLSNNIVYVAGYTNSSDFPSTSGGAQASFGGGTCGFKSCYDGFVTRLTPDLLNESIASVPTVITNVATNLGANSANLNGTVTANGADTTVTFDFGLTTAYDQHIAAVPGSIAGTAATTAVSANKTGLVCNTTYNYRVKSVNSAGTSHGQNASFKTIACNSVDLVITEIVLIPVSPLANRTFTAKVTVKNQGAVVGNGQFLNVWSHQPTSQVCDVTGDKSQTVGTIAAGASKIFTFSGLPAGTADMKMLRAFVDSGCDTAETNEGNNQSTVNYSVNKATVDFIVTNITLPTLNITPNGTFTAKVTVKNQGTVAGDDKLLDVWSHQPARQGCGAVGNQRLSVGILAAGDSKTLTFVDLPAGGTTGKNTLRAFVDSGCGIAETNEINNQITDIYFVGE